MSSHTTVVMTAMVMTVGTKMPETLSATLAMGALVAAASETIWMIWLRVVSSPTRVAWHFIKPLWLSVAAETVSPSALSTGMLSPVRALSFTALWPSSTTPSTGMFSPGRTTKMSPFSTSSTPTVTSCAVAHDGGGLGRELHEALEGVRGLALAAGLEHLAYGDEGQYHGRGLEVELSVHDVHLVHRVAVGRHLKERVGAPDEGGAGAEGDQGVHVRRPVREALEAGDEELLVDDHDYNSQIELDKRLGHVVRRQEIRQRPAPHHGAHGEIHEHYEEADGRDQAALEHRRLVVLQGGFRLGHGAGRCSFSLPAPFSLAP